MISVKVWELEEYRAPINENIMLPIVPRKHDVIVIRGCEHIVKAVIMESGSEEITVNLASPFAMGY